MPFKVMNQVHGGSQEQKTPLRLPIFDFGIDAITEKQFFEFVRERIDNRKPSFVVTPNLHFARLSRRFVRLRSILLKSDLSVCDSALLSLVFKLRGESLPARLPGSDLTPKLLRLAEAEGLRVFLFGSERDTLERVRGLFPTCIVGLESPPFCERLWELRDINERYARKIREADPDILFVALGVKKQEYWTESWLEKCGVPVTMCIGASLDFVGGRVRRSPGFVSRFGFEWLWRLFVEPKRLWRRYGGDAVFLLLNGPAEIFRYGFLKRSYVPEGEVERRPKDFSISDERM